MLKIRSRLASDRRLVQALAACAIGLGVFGDSSHASVVTYTYDNAGRLVTVYSTAGFKTTYSLDPAGNRSLVATVGTPVFISFTAATASTSSITLTWSATDNGGPGGLTYSVQNTTLSRAVSGCTASPCTDTGLSVGTNYAYTVTATDSNNNTGTAAANAWTLPGVPGTPTFTSIAATSATASWTAASGTVTSYAYTLNGGSSWTSVGNVLTTLISGLASGTSHSVQVRATNAGGTGSASAAGSFYTVPGAPGTPTFSSITGTTATMSWTAPSGTVTSYAYSLNNGSTWTSVGTALTASLTGLSVGTSYTALVHASNAGGTGASSSGSFTTVPAAPTLSVSPTTVYTGNGTTLSISWTVPKGTINHYTLSRSLNGNTPTTTTYPAGTTSTSGVAGKTAGSVTFEVHACESSDESECGAWSNTQTVTVISGCPPSGCP
jgi:YD repeat-containing protein